MTTARVQACMTKRTLVEALAIVTFVGALPLMVSLTGCASKRYSPMTGHGINDNRMEERGYDQSTEQRIEDSRTAERVREALAAVAGYRYDGVKVVAREGVVELSGFVKTSTQKKSAGDITSQVVGVKSVENNLTVKD